MRARKHLATSLPSTYVPGLHKTISLSVFPLSEHLLCRHRSNVSIRCSTVLKRRRATYPQSPPRGHLRRRAALQFRQARRLALSTHSCHSYSRRCDASEHVICCKCHYKDCCCSPLIGTFDSDPCVEVGGFFFFFFFFLLSVAVRRWWKRLGLRRDDEIPPGLSTMQISNGHRSRIGLPLGTETFLSILHEMAGRKEESFAVRTGMHSSPTV